MLTKSNMESKGRKRPYIKRQIAEDKWLPLTQVNRQKSQLKKLFRSKEELSHAFVVGELPHKSTIKKCVEDCSYTWITFVKKQELALAAGLTVKGKDVVEYMLSRVVAFFSMEQSNSYVMAFDKPAFVPRNKQEKQLRCYIEDRRDVDPFQWSSAQSEHVLEWDKEVPCNWDSMKANREARYQAIRDVVYMIRDNYRPPPGKRLIIDSDCFEEGPLVLLTTACGTHCHNYIDTTLKNCIGEGDNCIMYYVHAFSSGTADVDASLGNFFDKHCWNGSETDDILVHCSDTDVWLMLLMSYHIRQKQGDFVNRVIVHCGNTDITLAAQQSTELAAPSVTATAAMDLDDQRSDDFIAAMFSQETPTLIQTTVTAAPPPSQRITDDQQLVSRAIEYIDINALFDASMTFMSEAILPYAAESLFVVCIMGGNDYVDGYYGLSYAVLLRTWFTMCKDIGSLVEFNSLPTGEQLIAINPASYLSLLIRAYWHAYEKRAITQPNADNPPKKPPSPHFETSVSELSLQQLRKTVSRIRKKACDHVPSDIEISQKMLRTQWYLRYCYYSHHGIVPDPLRSCWEQAVVKYRTYFGDKGTRNIIIRKLHSVY